MKNSKVLSLLTAGALVVSSFSGLAFGSTAFAYDKHIGTAAGQHAWFTDKWAANGAEAADGAATTPGGTVDLNGGATNMEGYVEVTVTPAAGADFSNETKIPDFTQLYTLTKTTGTNVSGDGSITFTKFGVTSNAAAGTVTFAYKYKVTQNWGTVGAAKTTAAAVVGGVDDVVFAYASTGYAVNMTALGAGTDFTFTVGVFRSNVAVKDSTSANLGFSKATDATNKKIENLSWGAVGANQYLTVLDTVNLNFGVVKNGAVSPYSGTGAAGVYAAGDSCLVVDADVAKGDATGVTYHVSVTTSNADVVVGTPMVAGNVAGAAYQSQVQLTAYGVGSAVITLTLNNYHGTVAVTQLPVEVYAGTSYIRLYNKDTNLDIPFVTFDGTKESMTVGAERRGASYSADTDLKWLLVNAKAVRRETIAANAQTEAAKIVKLDASAAEATLTPVGNGTVYLYVYTTVGDVYKSYVAGSNQTTDFAKQMDALASMLNDQRPEVRCIEVYSTGKEAAVHTNFDSEDVKLRADGSAITITPWVNQQGVGVSTNAASATNAKITSSEDSAEKVVKITQNADGTIKVTPVAAGDATITINAEYTVNGNKKTPSTTVKVNVNDGSVTPEPEHKAGEPVKEDGVTGVVNEDGETVTVTDVTVVSKAITIPETIDGLTVTAIDAQAFKKSAAKTVYVYAPVEIINKGAFKASKVKKAYFYQPESLQTVGKNAFKKTNAKVVGVGAAFSDDAAKQLTKAGAKSVKNNGTAK